MYRVPDSLVNEFFDRADTPQRVRQRLEDLASPPPAWVQDEDELRRWVAASLTAAALALDQAPENAMAARHFAFEAARTLYRDSGVEN